MLRHLFDDGDMEKREKTAEMSVDALQGGDRQPDAEMLGLDEDDEDRLLY